MTVNSPGYQESRSSKKHLSGQVLFKLKQTNNNELKDIASYKSNFFKYCSHVLFSTVTSTFYISDVIPQLFQTATSQSGCTL